MKEAQIHKCATPQTYICRTSEWGLIWEPHEITDSSAVLQGTRPTGPSGLHPHPHSFTLHKRMEGRRSIEEWRGVGICARWR